MDTVRFCTYQGRTYPDGAMACDEEDCMLCIEGEWIDRRDLYDTRE